MEGMAEYFSLSLYPDKRWWKGNLEGEEEQRYWQKCQGFLKTADDAVKNPLCFGNPDKGIPFFAGYSFALKLVSEYVKAKPIRDFRDLFDVEPSALIKNNENTF